VLIKGEKMWIWIDAEVRPGKSEQEVKARRQEWIGRGKDKLLLGRCKSAQRFGILGSSPRRVFWIIETEDEGTPKLISEHFGDVWDIRSYDVIPQSIAEVLKKI